MDEFANLVPKGYGLRPQGKLAPMSATKGSSSAESVKGSSSSSNSGRSGNRGDDFFFTSTRNAPSSGGGGGYEDVFGGPPKFAAPPSSNSYDEIFRSQPPPAPPPPSKDHSLPVFDDAPPSSYGDDIFLGVRGTRPGVAYDSVFAGASSSGHPPADLLGGFQTNHVRRPSSSSAFEPRPTYDDDEGLIPGMGSSTYTSKPAAERSAFISVDDDAPAEPAEVDPFGDIQPDPFSGMPVPDPLDSFAAKSSNDAGDGFDGFDIFSQPSNVKTEGRKSAESVPVPKPVVESESDSDEASSPRKNKAQAVHEDYIPGSNFGTSAGYSDRGFTESWVTVDDVKLVTQPTMAPPPSRAPPGLSGYDISGPGRQYSNSFEDESPEPEPYNERPVKENPVAEFEEKVHVSNEEEIRIKKERMELEERERERLRKEREREVVDRVNRETRERSAKQARERAAERAAVERALHESRLRAAADAKQRAEEASRQAEVARQAQKADEAAKLKAEEAAKQKSEEELKQKDAERRAQRAAVERVTAAARERYEKAAAQRLKEQQQQQQQQQQKQQQQQQQHHRSSDDLDNIFHTRPNSAPRQRPPVPQDMPGPGAPSSVKKVSSVSGIDSLSDLFDNNGSGVEGETAERRKARLDRDQRTQARARQALEEKHRRDVAAQREQVEKQRASETVDAEIKRWAAGKEGNIRALLSSLQYVLWPECGWQPVSLTDLITGASVKKVYRKATLFVHPDKVQQKGATVQQKYIAEKVFDLLKEAWNKFNSEELF